MVLGHWKKVLTQTAFLCPVHSDQRNCGEGGIALRTLCISSGSDFRCPNGSRFAARRLFSKYLCNLETALAAWDGRSGSWRVERLGWGGLSSCCAEKLGWGGLSSCCAEWLGLNGLSSSCAKRLG